MFGLRNYCLAMKFYRTHWQQKSYQTHNIKERQRRITKIALGSLKQNSQEPPIKTENGLWPYIPEPDSPDYEGWLKRLEKAAKDIAEAAKGLR